MKLSALRKVAVSIAAGIAVTGFAACDPAPVDPTPPPTGWTLVGGDEFNGSSLDTSKWSAYNNTYGDGNNEYACLTPNNVAVTGGSLKITSKKETVTCPGNTVTFGAWASPTPVFIASSRTVCVVSTSRMAKKPS